MKIAKNVFTSFNTAGHHKSGLIQWPVHDWQTKQTRIPDIIYHADHNSAEGKTHQISQVIVETKCIRIF